MGVGSQRIIFFLLFMNKESWANDWYIKTCKIKKDGVQKEIDSNEQGLELNYTTKYKIETIEQANNFFVEAYISKENDIYTRMINLWMN